MIPTLLGKFRGDGLAARARRGSILTVLQFGSANVLRLISNLILTRLLFPEAFGLMALVQVVMAGVTMFSDLGIGAAIVQHKRGEEPDFLHTAWTLQACRGCLLWVIIVALAPWVSGFYDEPILRQILPVAGLCAVVQGFTPMRAMIASRNLELGRLTLVGLSNQALSITLTVILAWLYQSVWALVIGNLFGVILNNLMIRMFIRGLPDRVRFERAAVRDLLGFGSFVFFSTAATFIINNGDRALLGRFIELELLGIYTVAATLATVPVQLMVSLAGRIVFPLYSRRPPQDSEENRQKLFKARYALTSVVFAGGAVLALIGDPLVRFLYEPQYHIAGILTVVLTLGTLPMLIVSSYDMIMLSNNRSDLHAVQVVSAGALRLVVLYLGISTYGVWGAALAPTLATLLHYPILVMLIRRYRAWDPLHDGLFLLLSCGLCALSLWLYSDLLGTVPMP